MGVNRRTIYESLPDLDSDFVIVNATKPFKVATTRADAKGAVPLDAYNCLFARACRRKGLSALFLRTTAYVRRSAKVVEKYTVPKSGQVQILALDVAGVAMAGCTIELQPPPPGKQVGARKGDKSTGSTGRKLTKEQKATRIAAREALRVHDRHIRDIGWAD